MELKNKKILFCIFALLFSFSNSYAQDKPSVSKGNIQFYFDNAIFPGAKYQNYSEFYLMFYADQLKFRSSKGQLKIKSILTDVNGNIIRDDREWIIDVSVPDSSKDLRSKVVYDQWTESLKPGNYKIFVTAEDVNNPRVRGELSHLFSVNENSTNKSIYGSDIEFFTSSKTSAEANQFSKGNISIIPNPSRRFGILIPTLNFYYEVYNLASEGNLEISYIIKDSSGTEKKNLAQNLKKPGTTAALIQNIDISDLRSGIYNLVINVADPENKSSLTLKRDFEIIQADFVKGISSLSSEEETIFSKILSYIGTPSQQQKFKNLNSTGKAEYIINFWKELDPTPGTPENEYLEKIQQRFTYAANNFGWSNIKGWNTDMGRICIKYGLPDEVNQYNSESTTIPYQIWEYKENRGYEFVFADLQSEGRYVLLHSNREGEISNLNWRELITKSKF